jgi:beta-N-acetylhexosaminidase
LRSALDHNSEAVSAPGKKYPFMKLEHRIGQLLLVGIPGKQLDLITRGMLESIQPGGVILNAQNIENAVQLAELTAEIRGVINVPPMIAVDQEGGRVDRLKAIYSAMPAADMLRASGDASIAARMGEITAEALRTVGFNVNLAPVLDVAVDDSIDNGLKGRYLGSTPAKVVRLAGAYIEGLQRGGVLGVGKHFPGLGHSTLDSHSQLPTVDRSRDQITKEDLLPYTELFSKINARLNAVIIGHAHYPAIDGPSALPSSLSKNVVTGLLREELGYKGLTITDDLGMGAVTSCRELPEAAVAAIEAGNDMALVTGAGESDLIVSVWEAMVKAAETGRITKSHIGRAFDHIARIKAMISPPNPQSEMAVARLRERIGELNLVLQHSR